MRSVGIVVAIALSLLRANGFDDAVADYRAGNYIRALNGFLYAATEQHNAAAMFNVALMYEQGKGVRRDRRQAETWYRKAAEAGDANAMFNLAVFAEKRGDVEEAERWYAAAAKAGYVEALNNLAVLYLKKASDDPKAFLKAGMLLREAASAGSSYARKNLKIVTDKKP